MNFKFGWNIRKLNPSKRPLKILETRGRGCSQGLSKIFRAATYRAHRAVVFAIAHLSCFIWLKFGFDSTLIHVFSISSLTLKWAELAVELPTPSCWLFSRYTYMTHADAPAIHILHTHEMLPSMLHCLTWMIWRSLYGRPSLWPILQCWQYTGFVCAKRDSQL